MSIQIIPKERQAQGAFNGGEIVENKPIGFPREGGVIRPFSNLFYWAYAEANTDSTIGLHPHEGFEIMSFVLKGNIRHYDTKLNEWRPLKAGDAQIIRAGSGISHAEFLAKDAAIFQIWFDPNLAKTLNQPASYDDYKATDLPVKNQRGISVKTYVGAEAPISLDTQGLEIVQLSFDQADYHQQLSTEKIYSLYVLKGDLSINGNPVKKDDFIILKDTAEMHIQGSGAGSIFMISSPAMLNYKTYAQIMQERMRI
jgi:hypothetical protein